MIFKTVDISLGGESTASLTCYIYENSQENGLKHRPAIIVFPGGGYDYCSDREAEPVALRFLGAGFNAFVLRYSCVKKKFPLALLEGCAAVNYVRKNAAEYDTDPDKIFVCGFSAGGHLAASVSCHWAKDMVTQALGVSREDVKPNGAILAYPVITAGEFAHRGSIENLLFGADEKEREEITKLVSLEEQVSPLTPPTFLWHCADDGCVPVENSLMYMTALSKNKVPFESHIFEKGGHGLSLCNFNTANEPVHYQPVAEQWADFAIRWALRLCGKTDK